MKSHYVPAVSRVKTAGIIGEVNGPINDGSEFSNKSNKEYRVIKVTLSRLETLETQHRTVGDLVVTADMAVTMSSPMRQLSRAGHMSEYLGRSSGGSHSNTIRIVTHRILFWCLD